MKFLKTIKMLDTFAGIGGFSYASKYLIDPGIETTGFVEIDPFCQKILTKNFPDIPIYDDITTFTARPFQYDVISAGFPCQDISVAGLQKGITKESRSGLFYELMRVIRMVRPKYVVLENVAAILNNGLDIVLRELSEAGYDAEWAIISASSLGACHRRSRWFCIAINREFAYTDSIGCRGGSSERRTVSERQFLQRKQTGSEMGSEIKRCDNSYTDTKGSTRDEHEIKRKHGKVETQEIFRDRDSIGDPRKSSNPNSKGLQGRLLQVNKKLQNSDTVGSKNSSSDRSRISNSDSFRTQSNNEEYNPRWKVPVGNAETRQTLNPNWRGYVSEPCLRRGDDGLSNRIYRLKALGNSVLPQCAAIPLQRVLDIEKNNANLI